MVRYLTKEEIKTINKYLAIEYGFDHLVLKLGVLDQCVQKPQLLIYGQEIFPDKIEKAAALMRELNKQHVFLHGNKRTAFLAAKMFLKINGYQISVEQQTIVNVSVETAQCHLDTPELYQWMQPICKRAYWEPIT